MGRFSTDSSDAGAPPDTSLELLGIEPLEDHARRLAALLTVRTSGRKSTAHLNRLDAHMRALREVYVTLTDDARLGEERTPAAEWLLDNFHLISAAARDIRHDLPSSFYQRLPVVASDEFAGSPRVYAMARELIGRSAGRLDPQRLQRFVSAFQSITPLTMGELWAWPSALKLALIDYVRARADALAASRMHRVLADRLAASRDPASKALAWPDVLHPALVVRLLHHSREHEPSAGVLRQELDARLAAGPLTLEDAIRAEGRDQATSQAFMSSLFGSLHLISTFDWTEFFESVSLVEQVLQRDPIGVYSRMDFRSRDRYRHAVEEMAEPTGESQLRVALKAVERARQIAERTPGERSAHVGFYLIGGGRRQFEHGIGWRPRLGLRIRRLFFLFATPGYLGTIALGTAVLVLAALRFAHEHGAPRGHAGVARASSLSSPRAS